MSRTRWLAALALSALCCGNEDGMGLEDPAQQVDETDSDITTDETQNALSNEDSSGYYNCFQQGKCSAPSLTGSTRCIRGRDYDASATDRRAEVLVLSFHGGLIEANTTEVARLVSDRLSWSHYDFSGHGSSSCLGGMSNHDRLHITATNFDDPAALKLMAAHKKAVAMHGYSSSRGNQRGTICVGGANSKQVAQFITTMNENKSSFSQYSLRPVNSATAKVVSGANCSGLTGTARSNLVNRASNGQGGLQLEMSDGLRTDLLNSSSRYDALRSVFYASLKAAMAR